MSGASASALPMWIGGLAVVGAVAAGAVYMAGRGGGADPEDGPSQSAALPAITAPSAPSSADTSATGDTPPESSAEPNAAPPSETTATPPAPEQTLHSRIEEPAPEPPGTVETPPAADLPLPRIDEFRFDPRGIAVLAGRSAPGDALVLRLDGNEITRADADGQGAFAAIALLDPSPEARVLTLAALGADGQERLSPDELIIAPMPVRPPVSQTMEPSARLPGPVAEDTADTAQIAAAPAAEDTVPDPGAVVAAPAVPETASSAAEPAMEPETDASLAAAPQTAAASPADDAPAPVALPESVAAAEAPAAPNVSAVGDTPTAPDTPAQVAILRSGPDGVDVVQAPGRQAGAPPAVMLDAISYSALGDVQLSGRAETGASEVRIYLDNRPIAALSVAPGGDWRGDVQGIEAGVYTLRIDAVDPAGAVQSRVETPFKREAPAVLQAAAAQGNLPVQAITVQRGATLWAIARERYGDPLLYVQVFEANRDQIRDPDLIYPGQVFTLPETGE